MKKYLIICEETCPECEGKKIIFDPMGLWKKYHEYEKELKEKTGKDFPELWEHEEEIDEWWQETSGFRGFKAGDLPPEEETCEWCEGTGIERKEVNLEDVLIEWGVMQLES